MKEREDRKEEDGCDFGRGSMRSRPSTGLIYLALKIVCIAPKIVVFFSPNNEIFSPNPQKKVVLFISMYILRPICAKKIKKLFLESNKYKPFAADFPLVLCYSQYFFLECEFSLD
jgi:hypothetical protein